MKRPLVLLCTFILLGLSCSGQAYTRYKIVFTDKNGTPFSLNEPQAYLSARAILRRQRQGIPVDSTDLPIVPRYIDSVMAAGPVTLLNHCNWLNQIVIQTSDPAALGRIAALPFVKAADSIGLRRAAPLETVPADKFSREKALPQTLRIRNIQEQSALDYGASYAQIHLHHGDFLHDKGLLGQGMVIAMLDAGFDGINTNRALDSLFMQQRLLYTWNYVYDTSYVFAYHWHGANCLSIIASDLPGQMIGSAPRASFLLLLTEDVRSEQPIEEDNWAAAAQFADSAGADLITSSLGYSLFDNPAYNLSYSDLNGKVADISIAASLAVKKGMIVVNAAGNDGLDSWKHIIAPADGYGVLAVGAVDARENIAPFSSFGPTADGRISPVVASVGWNTDLVDTSGMVTTGSGTSYATPNMAGLVACLWEAFPNLTNYQILTAVEKSADHYSDPGDQIGFGVPDFEIAYDSLQQIEQNSVQAHVDSILGTSELKVFPNPFNGLFHIAFRSALSGPALCAMYDASGRMVAEQSLEVTAGTDHLLDWNLPGEPDGLYFVRITLGSQTLVAKVIHTR